MTLLAKQPVRLERTLSAIAPKGRLLTLPLFLLLGFALRLGWLAWQPLWADEGYSVYFATEATPRLLWLTAHDIHPPLYYLLLQGWLHAWPAPTPVGLRLFAVLLATPTLFLGFALAYNCFGGRRQPSLLFLLLLLANPLYLYYSQEVRMYGLVLTLSLAATPCFLRWVMASKAGKAALGWLAAYVVVATAALYTLYYLAFLLLAHLVWVHWVFRKEQAHLRRFWLADGLVGLLYLPWVLYTAQILIQYVNDKIRSDQDVALGLWPYLVRHLLAFTSGHLPFPAPFTLLPWLALGSVLGLLLWLGVRRPNHTTQSLPMAQNLFWLCLLLPFTAAFVINRFYPFFPVGGERLLLFTLPYCLLLVTSALDDLWQPRQSGWRALGGAILFLLIASAGAGIWVFYTLPRYQADDYRPLIRQIVQQGSDTDTVVATFPWQVGFWRTYAPQAGLPPAAGPHIALLSDRSVVWDASVAQRLDQALARGMLWLPTLRSIGSSLPAAMDAYLADRAINFVQRWASATTQLDAWHRPQTMTAAPVAWDWGDVQLVSAGVNTTTLPAANFPLLVELTWQSQGTLPAYGVTLRLQKDGLTWAYRDYDALGSFVTHAGANLYTEQVGLLIPPGVPPGDYQLVIGLVAADNSLRKPLNDVAATVALLPLATLAITPPVTPPPPFRLPIQFPLAHSVPTEGVALLGYSGGDAVITAGTSLAVTLFWQSQADALPQRQLFVSLLDQNGAGVAGWEGWPLPTYPLPQWTAGSVAQTPLAFVIPASVTSGAYRLVAGLLDPVTGVKQPPLALGVVQIYQRPASFTATPPPISLAAPAQFGAHVQLLGYDQQRYGNQLALTLYWHVLQPLLPPHHIFVHLDNPAGVTLAQADGDPQTASEPAPTGSWQPGEYLVTQHRVTMPATSAASTILLVGLYVPESGVRLPLTIDGNPAGDGLQLPLNP